jgi:CoA-transferase family III
MAERLFRAIGRADMITDPRFRTNSDRVRNAEACEAPIVAFIGARTLAENMEIFEHAEVTASPVYDIDQFMADPHVIAREILVDLPDTQIGQLPMHNVIPRLSATPGRLRRPAPAFAPSTSAPRILPPRPASRRMPRHYRCQSRWPCSPLAPPGSCHWALSARSLSSTISTAFGKRSGVRVDSVLSVPR